MVQTKRLSSLSISRLGDPGTLISGSRSSTAFFFVIFIILTGGMECSGRDAASCLYLVYDFSLVPLVDTWETRRFVAVSSGTTSSRLHTFGALDREYTHCVLHWVLPYFLTFLLLHST